MPAQLVSTAFALLAGAVVAFLLSKPGDDLRSRWRSSLIGSVLGGSLVTLLWIQVEAIHLRDLRDVLTKPNPLSQLDAKLDAMGHRDGFANRLRSRKDELLADMGDLADGTLGLRSQDEVVDEWQGDVASSVSTIDATNFVAPSFWKTANRFASEQERLQRLAVERGVRIRRVFIYFDTDPNDIQRIRELGSTQSQSGIHVRYISHRRLVGLSTYSRYKTTLRGAFDIVLFDLNRALLTYTDAQSRLIESGFASNSRVIVDSAREFLEAIWSMSDEAPAR